MKKSGDIQTMFVVLFGILMTSTTITAIRCRLGWVAKKLVADDSINSYTSLILIYSIIFLIFFVAIWLYQRIYVKHAIKNENDTFYSLLRFSSILPTLIVAGLLFTIVYSSPLKESLVAVTFTISFFEIIQLFIITALLVSFFYVSIEQILGNLIFKEVILPSKNSLNMRFAEEQFRFSTQKIWHLALLLFGSALFIANILVFFAYPSLPSKFDDPTIALFYPNVFYRYDSALGARQELFSAYFIPPKILINWKLIQSLLSIGYFIIFVIFLNQKVDEKKHFSNENEQAYIKIKDLIDSEESMINLSILLLSPYQPPELYVPLTSFYIDSPSKMESFANKVKNSALIPVLKLALINFGISYVIILIAQMLGVLDLTDLVKLYHIQFTQLYWAGYSEELTFRLLLIGVPLFLIHGTAFLINKYFIDRNRSKSQNKTKRFTLVHTSISPLKYLIGGWEKFSLVDWFFLIVSSAMFGYAHFQFGWPLWKIVQTGVVGVIIGYAYCKYGLHAAIFLHVTMDFSAGLLLPLNLGWMSIGVVILIFLMLFGFLYVFYYATKGVKWTLIFIGKMLGRSIDEL